MAYSEKVLEHFFNPRNIGSIQNADGIGSIGSESCGDAVRVWIRVKEGRLEEIKYQVFGCPAAIACCSMMTEMATGQDIKAAIRITDKQVAEQLGGLTEEKLHCSGLAASALHRAIESYLDKEKAMSKPLKITVLVDNTASDDLEAEHGLALWIEYGQKHILFDTGQSDIIIKNAERLGIDLARTDAVVLSHGHYDHTGGLAHVLEIAPEAVVYLHPDAAQLRYNLKGKSPKDISMPKAVCRALGDHAAGGKVVYTEKPEPVVPGMMVTGFVKRAVEYEQISDNFHCDPTGQKQDLLNDDQSLLISTGAGTVLLLGCAHAGVVNTLTYAESLVDQPIYALIGGMHLRSASQERLDLTFKEIEQRNIRILSPMHCTGQKATEKMQQEFSESFRKFSAGETIVIPPAGD